MEIHAHLHEKGRDLRLDLFRGFANWAIYLLVGYEQSTLQRDPLTYEWISNQMLDHLESGRFITVPPR
jgi:hypothetical protein